MSEVPASCLDNRLDAVELIADAATDQHTIAQDEEAEAEADITPTPEASETVIEAGPLRDPQRPPTSSSTIANDDYFTQFSLPTTEFHPAARHAELKVRETDAIVSLHTPKPQASVAGSNATAPGTIVRSESASTSLRLESATKHQRDASLTPTNIMDSGHARHTPSLARLHTDTDDADLSTLASTTGATARTKPAYPNQAYAALHHQHYPTRSPPPTLRTRSSHPSHILAFPAIAPGIHHSGSRTVGNSPAATPSAGLYSPPDDHRLREEWDSPETPGTYASPYLHPTHRQAPKETHVADVDVDPISGRKIINHYEIIDELGRGTHGKVKLGRDLGTSDTYVAIKIVERYSKKRRLGKLGNPEDKVKKEVAILKKARHPNIVALLEVIDDPSRKKVYIVLEWVERGTIQWRVKAPKELAMLEARQYERLRGNVDSAAMIAEDAALRREVHRRLSRRKHDIDRRYRQARKGRNPDRGIDHFGGSNFESDDDTLSRTSTESGSHSFVHAARHADAERNSAEAPITPLATDASSLMDASLMGMPATATQHDLATIAKVAARTDLRQWAIDYLDGDLNPELQYVPCMTLPNIRIAFRDTLLGLQYLHHQGIIHRDIKPPNLLQTTDHRVKISDFGVSYLGRPVYEGEQGEGVSENEAKDLDDEAKELAKTVGTPAFYAPELCITDHLDDPPPITKAIDVWALGITLFCMIYARTPFVDSEYVVMRQISEEEIHIPRLRLQPVDQRSESRSNSRARTYSPQRPESRSELDVEYEEIGDELLDLLKRLLIRDPRKRILLEEVRHHPWVVADLPNKLKWLEETDPHRQADGKKIEVSKEDLNAAVVPLQFLERMRSGIKKIGDRLLASTSRGRSASSATPPGSATNSHPASAHSSSSTISQDARRHSLRSEEIFTALKASRESDHPLSKSLAASPELEKSNREFFEQMPDASFDGAYGFGAPLLQTMSYDSAARPSLPGRSKTGYSTTGSIRTIKQSDFADHARQGSPPSPHIAETPRALDSPGSSQLSGLLGGSGRSIFKVIRDRSAAPSIDEAHDSNSPDHFSIASPDAHAEPSLALSDALAAGRVDGADVLLARAPGSSADNSAQNSPVALRPHSVMLPPGYRSAFGSLSRKSSAGSVISTGNLSHDVIPEAAKWQKSSTNESSAENWHRADQERMRKLLLEAHEPSRTTTPFDDRTCPPSPDDHRERKGSDAARRASEFDISQPVSPNETSPTTHGGQLPGSLVSSSSDFGSAVSMSISNPSIPSVISEASSIDAADGAPLEDGVKYIANSHDTIRSLPRIADELVDEGYNAEADSALDSDDADYDDSDTDSDGGLVMLRRKSATRLPILSSSPKVGSFGAGSSSLSSTLEAHSQQKKQRRGTGLSKSSKKSSRSGSNNTMKKVRTRDSIDERRRESTDIEEVGER